MGELHLEIIVDRLRREFKVECDVGAPQVNYREGISRTAEVRFVHKKQSGGSGQFADVAIRFEPGEAGTGFTFKSEIKGGAVPKEYIPGVLKGLQVGGARGTWHRMHGAGLGGCGASDKWDMCKSRTRLHAGLAAQTLLSQLFLCLPLMLT